ncbi:uncharacterized protein LOC110861457 [Folsomia candida]|uniref:Uncharacterized protein n=1 Tax=Folsomia candida TaxID=158441 RepID=A0A226D076_FOLCA|nr:uncharacterized protein LOC110861457 [Folsomia candida]OXA38985.1 hypothetical protein Fcan01_26278 [Folsomia candida]
MKFQLRHSGVCPLLALLLLALVLPAKSTFDVEKCRGVDLDATEDHMMHVTDCLSKAGAKEFHDVPAEKMPCFGKCVMEKKGIIDDKGLPHKENIMKLITDNMPKAVHDDLNKRMENCLAEETSMIDPADPSCNTYMPLGMCMHLSFLEECEK